MPFFQPANEVSESEKSAAEEAMKAARVEASSSVGELIAAGQDFTSEKCRNVSRWYLHQCPEWGITRTEVMPPYWPFY